MKGIDMYTKIQQLKALKYSQRGAAEALGIHRDTVRRYWNMSVEDYEAEVSKIRKVSVLDEYKTVILSWIKANPHISSAQICDWLKEDYPRIAANDPALFVMFVPFSFYNPRALPESLPRRGRNSAFCTPADHRALLLRLCW